jgi:hypothetical protein
MEFPDMDSEFSIDKKVPKKNAVEYLLEHGYIQDNELSLLLFYKKELLGTFIADQDANDGCFTLKLCTTY